MTDIVKSRFLIISREPTRSVVTAEPVLAEDMEEANIILYRDQESTEPKLKDPVDEHLVTLAPVELRKMANQGDELVFENLNTKLEFTRAITLTVPQGFWMCVQELTRNFKTTSIIRATRFGGQLDAISNKGREFHDKCQVPANRLFVAEVVRLADHADITCLTFRLDL